MKIKLKEAAKSSKLQKTKNRLSKRLFEDKENVSPKKNRPKKKEVKIVANLSEESSTNSYYQPVKKFRGLLAAKLKGINKNKKKTEKLIEKTKEKRKQKSERRRIVVLFSL